MRGGAHVKEALGVVTLLWNHPILTGLLLLIFTPPFFPLVVYFSPLLMSTGLCVVALVSVGSQMEKIKAEGGPGQLENHLGREQGVSRWVPRENRPGRESMERHHYGQRENHRSLYASSGININVVPVPPSWTGGNSGHNLATTRAIARLRPEPVQNHPPTPLAEESEEDWWDNWVKEYESRPGWGEQEDQTLPAPAIRTSSAAAETVSQAPATPTIPTAVMARSDRHQDAPPMTPRKPVRQETRGEKPPPVPVAAPVAAAPVSVTVVNRQEVSRSLLPPPPTTSTSRTSQEEIVVSVKESDLRPHMSLAPIRTGRQKRDFRQVDSVHSNLPAAQASDIQEVPLPRSVDVERVSDVQALQSIEKLLQMEMEGSNMATPPTSLSRNVIDVKNAGLGNSSGSKPQVSVAREAVSPQLSIAMRSGSVVSTGKGIAVEASEKNRNKITIGAAAPGAPAEDIAGETPLLRHLKTSRSVKQARSAAYSPLPVRSSKGLMSEKVLPPPQFSPRVLQSLQPLPPKGFSPRLPNLSTVPLGNPVEKIPQWVYDGIPKERAQRTESQNVKQVETAEEKHVRAFEQAVKVLSYTRRRKHARRPAPIQVDSAALQARWDVNTPSSTPAETTPASTWQERPEQTPSRVSPHRPASRASSPQRASPGKSAQAENLPARISEDVAEERGHGAAHQSSSQDSIEMAPATLPTPRASAAFSPRISPSAVVAASPQKAAIAVSPRRASRAASPQPASIAASPRRASRAASPQPASITASPRPASPQPASIAASPRSVSPQSASIGASPRPASPQTASIAASPRPASPHSASIGASPRPASVATSPRKVSSVAASPRRASPGHKPSIISSAPWPASVGSSPQKPASIAASPQRASVASSPQRASIAASPRPPSRAPSAASSPHRSSDRQSSSSTTHSRRRRHSSKHCTDKVAFLRIEGSTYYDPPSAAEREKKLLDSPSEEYVPIEQEVTLDPPSVEAKNPDSNCVTPPSGSEGAALRWGRSYSAARKSRRRLEPRRVVTSQDTDMFSLKKSFSTRNGETKKFVDSSSDDERESATPRASTRSLGRTIKPLVWRSRSVQAREDSD